MNPKHKSVTVKLIQDTDTSPASDGADWLGEWYGLKRGEEGRPDGGYYKVTRSTRSHTSNNEYVVWLKPPADCPCPKDCVDIARAWYREEWWYVGVVVEQRAAITGDDGKEYIAEERDSLFGIEHGDAYRSSPSSDWPNGERAIFSRESTEEYLREVMGECRGEVELRSGVAIPEDEWEAAVALAFDNGPIWDG